ncbi:MAG: hypothetical protein C5B52_05615 [Bacteroidetes bacterium]|nr:MAG: hypothetical protein C5B52_05615 [Bacteroidota bacterium]
MSQPLFFDNRFKCILRKIICTMKYTLVAIFALSSLFASAQGKWKKATLVTRSEDSIQVLIDDKEWAINPASFKLKQSLESPVVEWKASQIMSIKIENGDHYISEFIKTEEIPEDMGTDHFDSSQVKSHSDTLLLLSQFEGEIYSLYSYNDGNKTRFFIRTSAGLVQELIHRKYLIRKDGNSYEVNDQAYIEQLRYYTSDCAKVTRSLETLGYYSGELSQFMIRYERECHNGNAVRVTKKPKKGTWSFGLLAGETFTQYSLKTDDGYTSDLGFNKNFNANGSASFGVRVNYVLPRMKKKLSLLVDLYYNHSAEEHSEYTSYDNSDLYTEKTVALDFSFLISNWMIRYSFFPESAVRPFVNFGLTLTNTLKNGGKFKVNYHYNGDDHYLPTNDPFKQSSFNNFQYGICPGAGLAYKGFGLEYRYENVSELINSPHLKSGIHRNSVFLSYNLFSQSNR